MSGCAEKEARKKKRPKTKERTSSSISTFDFGHYIMGAKSYPKNYLLATYRSSMLSSQHRSLYAARRALTLTLTSALAH